jgi:hypothetical protein
MKTIVLIIILLQTTVAISQNKTDEKLFVTSFVKAVFFEKEKAKSIAETYTYFEPIDNSKYSVEDRVKILGKHLKKVKKEKGSLLNPADFSVISYNDYKSDKAFFSKETDRIFILVSNKNVPIMYFLLKNGRIFSFDYITKGDESLFITY